MRDDEANGVSFHSKLPGEGGISPFGSTPPNLSINPFLSPFDPETVFKAFSMSTPGFSLWRSAVKLVQRRSNSSRFLHH